MNPTEPPSAASLALQIPKPSSRRVAWWAVLPLGAAVLTGCINVTAPEEPIVIELNVNIRQEVIYRLAADASNLIDENEDIF